MYLLDYDDVSLLHCQEENSVVAKQNKQNLRMW